MPFTKKWSDGVMTSCDGFCPCWISNHSNRDIYLGGLSHSLCNKIQSVADPGWLDTGQTGRVHLISAARLAIAPITSHHTHSCYPTGQGVLLPTVLQQSVKNVTEVCVWPEADALVMSWGPRHGPSTCCRLTVRTRVNGHLHLQSVA